MNLYRVTAGPLQLGAGLLLSLDAGQLARRRHRVDVVEAAGDRAVVRPREPIDFKQGELVGLGEVPKAIHGRVEPVEAADEKPKGKAKAAA